ncbi:MAG: type II toxin-antitoxin system VapC family toxin [Caldilineaceae bacterium]|nr:type II toxin-antitoxin system VapC family toxin [Caldilineaceae bacterium]
MKVQRVYIDTSVIGGCLDQEFAIWSKGLLKDFQKGNFLLVISTTVAAEVAAAYEAVQIQYEDFLSIQPEILDVTEQAIALAQAYQVREILTPKYYTDGLHIALATVAEVDVLVSWNFKHIVHFNKIRLFNAVNLEMGYKPIQIYSPREVTSYEVD